MKPTLRARSPVKDAGPSIINARAVLARTADSEGQVSIGEALVKEVQDRLTHLYEKTEILDRKTERILDGLTARVTAVEAQMLTASEDMISQRDRIQESVLDLQGSVDALRGQVEQLHNEGANAGQYYQLSPEAEPGKADSWWSWGGAGVKLMEKQTNFGICLDPQVLMRPSRHLRVPVMCNMQQRQTCQLIKLLKPTLSHTSNLKPSPTQTVAGLRELQKCQTATWEVGMGYTTWRRQVLAVCTTVGAEFAQFVDGQFVQAHAR